MQLFKQSKKAALSHLLIWTMFLFIAMVSFSCRQDLPPEAARKHLKAFDNETVQLAKRIGKTEAFKALMKLSTLRNPPIPYMSNAAAYDFDAQKGVYQFDESNQNFEKLTTNNAVTLIYPFDSAVDSLATFNLIDYAETQTALQMIFPKSIEATITLGEKTVFKSRLSATYEHDLPAKMNVEMIFSNIKVRMLLNTTFKRDHAEINLEFELEENGKKMFTINLTSDVKRLNNVLYYSNLDISLAAFPIQLTYQSDLDLRRLHPENFIESFNKQTQFHFSTVEGKYIGQVFLAQIAGRDRINPVINYSDASTENLEDMLLIVQKLLNMKMFMRDGGVQASLQH